MKRTVPAAVVILAYLSSRILTFSTFHPWWAGDSGGYAGPFAAAWSGQAALIDGARPPIYPIVLGISQLLRNDVPSAALSLATAAMVTRAQALVALFALSALYWLARRGFSMSRAASCVAVAAVGVFLPIAVYDRIILTESLGTSLLILSAATIFGTEVLHTSVSVVGRWLGGAAAGAIWAAAVLTRPNFIAAVAILLMFSLVHDPHGEAWPARVTARCTWLLRRIYRRLKVFAVPLVTSAVLVGSWIAFNGVNTGYAKISNYEGISLTGVCYDCMDAVEADYPVFARIMADLNRGHEAAGSAKTDVIQEALPQIFAAADAGNIPGLSCCGGKRIADLNAYIGRATRAAIVKRPASYVRHVLSNIVSMPIITTDWVVSKTAIDPRAPGAEGSVIKREPLMLQTAPVVRVMDRLGTFLLVVFYLLPLILLSRSTRRRIPYYAIAIWCAIVAMNLACCLVAPWFPRYSVPTLPLCLVVTFAVLAEFFADRYVGSIAHRDP